MSIEIKSICPLCSQETVVISDLAKFIGRMAERSAPLQVKIRQGLPATLLVSCTNCSQLSEYILDQEQKTDVVYTAQS